MILQKILATILCRDLSPWMVGDRRFDGANRRLLCSRSDSIGPTTGRSVAAVGSGLRPEAAADGCAGGELGPARIRFPKTPCRNPAPADATSGTAGAAAEAAPPAAASPTETAPTGGAK